MSRGSAQRSAARHSLRGTASASIASPQMRRGVEASCSGDDRHRVAHDQLRHAAPRTISYAVQRKNVRHHGVRTCASCDERVGTSTMSAGRMPMGGASSGIAAAARLGARQRQRWPATRREKASSRSDVACDRTSARMVKPQKESLRTNRHLALHLPPLRARAQARRRAPSISCARVHRRRVSPAPLERNDRP